MTEGNIPPSWVKAQVIGVYGYEERGVKWGEIRESTSGTGERLCAVKYGKKFSIESHWEF